MGVGGDAANGIVARSQFNAGFPDDGKGLVKRNDAFSAFVEPLLAEPLLASSFKHLPPAPSPRRGARASARTRWAPPCPRYWTA